MDTNYSQYFNRKDEEEFLEFESKVNQVMRMLDDLANAQKNQEDEVKEDDGAQEKKFKFDDIDPDNFIVSIKSDRTVINTAKKDEQKPDKTSALELDKFTFMQQMEEDANKRAKIKEEQQNIAQNFRKLGNEAYRKLNYEKAIDMYTKAIEHVKNSPILYNNRALCYFKLRNFKRALMDCEYVISKLDEKNLRAWLYRSACYKRMLDEPNFESSIRYCKKHNPKKITAIDEFIEKIREM